MLSASRAALGSARRRRAPISLRALPGNLGRRSDPAPLVSPESPRASPPASFFCVHFSLFRRPFLALPSLRRALAIAFVDDLFQSLKARSSVLALL